MSLTPSTMLPLGTAAPDFRLPDTQRENRLARGFQGQDRAARHFHVQPLSLRAAHPPGLAQLANDYLPRGVAMVGINSNDAANFPEDSPAKMAAEVKAAGYLFPYLYDESQAVAKAFHAACTPDFFLFDRGRRLVYRGQFDAAGPATEFRRRARMCARRSTPCSPGKPLHNSRRRARAATSSGRPATHRRIFERERRKVKCRNRSLRMRDPIFISWAAFPPRFHTARGKAVSAPPEFARCCRPEPANRVWPRPS